MRDPSDIRDVLRDPTDTRDIAPRLGSPLWFHMTGVTVMGAAVLVISVITLVMRPQLDHIGRPPHSPFLWQSAPFWVIAAMVVLGDIWPIITPGRNLQEAPKSSVTFSFAVLMVWGMPIAVLLRTASVLLAYLGRRKAPHRAAFNAAGANLSLAAGGAVLYAFHDRHMPDYRWVTKTPASVLEILVAGVAVFAVNYVVVGIAIALHGRQPIGQTLRHGLPYQALVSLVLLASAPIVAVVIATRSSLLLALFGIPLAATYVGAAISVQREHQAQHDELTGLANRKMMLQHLAATLARAVSSDTKVGFLLLDLDRGLKEVNDTLGHAVGDRLLRLVAHRLTHSVRPGDLVARLGGDEFAVLLPSIKEASAAREVAARLRAAVAEPIRLEGLSFVIEVSIGIAMFPDDAPAAETLVQHADVAMYLAKQRRSGAERYVADLDRNSPARLALFGELRRGLDRGELELHYQPILNVVDRRTVGMEALIRWRHPVRGMMTPGEFIPQVQQSYLMREVTAFVIEAALTQAALWRQSGLGVRISLNVSGRDLLGNELVNLVEEGLARHRLPAEALLLEIDERVLTSEPAHAAATAEALAALGVGLSLDDFGTGYSSLVRLRRLPVSEVKIDSSFVGRLLESPEDEVVVKSIVDLAAALGIRSVAEGVESADVAAALLTMGCEAGQGWYYGKPMNAVSATAWLTENRDGAEVVKGSRAKPGRSQLAEADRSRLTEADRSRLTEADRSRLTEADRSRLAEADRSRLTEADRSRLTEADRSRLTEADRSRLTEADHNGTDERVPATLPPSAGLG
jgi:diguanylate cyclase (GGDEF)-like protein